MLDCSRILYDVDYLLSLLYIYIYICNIRVNKKVAKVCGLYEEFST
jgi:hypothetical protein